MKFLFWHIITKKEIAKYDLSFLKQRLYGQVTRENLEMIKNLMESEKFLGPAEVKFRKGLVKVASNTLKNTDTEIKEYYKAAYYYDVMREEWRKRRIKMLDYLNDILNVQENRESDEFFAKRCGVLDTKILTEIIPNKKDDLKELLYKGDFLEKSFNYFDMVNSEVKKEADKEAKQAKEDCLTDGEKLLIPSTEYSDAEIEPIIDDYENATDELYDEEVEDDESSSSVVAPVAVEKKAEGLALLDKLTNQ